MKKSFEKKGRKDKKLLDVASCLIQTYIQKVCFIGSNVNEKQHLTLNLCVGKNLNNIFKGL